MYFNKSLSSKFLKHNLVVLNQKSDDLQHFKWIMQKVIVLFLGKMSISGWRIQSV